MIFVIVETSEGDQHFFDRPYEGFRFAKEQEKRQTNSVEYVAVGNFWDDDGQVYTGQTLRMYLRALDNLPMWLVYTSDNHGEDDIQTVDG